MSDKYYECKPCLPGYDGCFATKRGAMNHAEKVGTAVVYSPTGRIVGYTGTMPQEIMDHAADCAMGFADVLMG